MKNLLKIILIYFLVSNDLIAQSKLTTEMKISIALADEQLKAYNKRDIEGFLKPYSDSVKVYSYMNNLLYQGKGRMRDIYTQMFEKNIDLKCKLLNRIAMKDKVIDHEEVTTKKGKPAFRAIAIYTIKEGKIIEVNFIQ